MPLLPSHACRKHATTEARLPLLEQDAIDIDKRCARDPAQLISRRSHLWSRNQRIHPASDPWPPSSQAVGLPSTHGGTFAQELAACSVILHGTHISSACASACGYVTFPGGERPKSWPANIKVRPAAGPVAIHLLPSEPTKSLVPLLVFDCSTPERPQPVDPSTWHIRRNNTHSIHPQVPPHS
ncbi:hypothetical protein LX32DRAFT_67621 [Colletotrichum zoysiae]|uniref:Uncharacterized protein n=1 Tax=Colletotrichum zoysiae TaxID=1216348 RepID=A0AAD9H9Z9_9PEZI|nr:hypothetical protein LX32DRAFT_67621 [Colletotrichum zoysiae]